MSDRPAGRSGNDRRTAVLLVLATLFATALVTAQLTATKLAVLSLPVLGAVTFPAGTFAYAGTFFATDVTSELFGKRTARTLVNVGFLMNFVMLAIVWIAIGVPIAGTTTAPQSEFALVMGASTNVVLGSLVAYLVSQNWDVIAFHRLRKATDGEMLWLRNVASTGSSQFLDTVIFVLVAFWAAPVVLGLGRPFPTAILLSTIVGQFALKLLLAVLDTPLVYAAVGVVRQRTSVGRPADAA
jgi:uncharacterized integral membrane protein (TIGR00697 family)